MIGLTYMEMILYYHDQIVNIEVSINQIIVIVIVDNFGIIMVILVLDLMIYHAQIEKIYLYVIINIIFIDMVSILVN